MQTMADNVRQEQQYCANNAVFKDDRNFPAKSYAWVWCMPLLSCPCRIMILHMLYPSDTHSSAIACSYHKHQSETPPHPKKQTTAFLRLNLQPPGAAAATAAAAAVLRIVTNYCTKGGTA